MSGPKARERLTETLAQLVAVQRASASGSLVVRGAGGGVLIFDRGQLFKARKDGQSQQDSPGAAGKGDANLRADAMEILGAGCAAGGEATFIPASKSAARAVAPPISINAGDLILDLVHASAEAEWVRSKVTGEEKIRHNTSRPPVMPRLALSASEGYLMSRADGTLSVEEIKKVSPLDENETLIAIYALLAAGFLVAPGLDLLGEIPRLAAHAEAQVAAAAGSSASATAHAAATAGSVSRAPATAAAHAAATVGSAARAPATIAAAGERTTAQAPPAPEAPAPQKKISDLDAFLKRTSATPAAAPTTASSAEDRARIEKRIAECQTEDLYAVLGVDMKADESAIRRAYYKIAKSFHPDRHRSDELADLFPAIETMFAKTTDAYNTLIDPKARAEYDAHGTEPGGGAKKDQADPAARARQSYARARKHLEAEEHYDALRLLETACDMDPSKAEYWLHLGIVQTKNPKWRKKAEASLLKAAELSPGSAVPLLSLARLYKAGGLLRKSREMYEKCLEWEPGNDEALTELGRKPAGKKSIFGGSKS